MPPGPPPPAPELVARVWTLYQEGLSYTGIGEAMGLPKSTVATYIRKARTQHGYLELLEEAERRDSLSSWLSLAVAKANYWLERCENPREYAMVSGAMVSLAKRLASLHGLDRPQQVEILGKDSGTDPVDVALIAAIRDAQRRNEEDIEDLRRGGPGTIEGGS